MRDYGKVYSSFWTSEDVRSMSDDTRHLALYLMTCPHNTIAGVFRLPDGYVCDDMNWCSERVTKGFVELSEKGFAYRCETTKWVWIRKHLEWNPPENPNQRKSAAKIALSVPDKCGWKPVFASVMEEKLGIEFPPINNPYETLPKPFLNQEQEQEQEQKQEQDISAEQIPAESTDIIPAGVPPTDEKTQPSREETELQVACRRTWAAYSDAYAQRHGAPPVRNKTINSQVKQFVQRIPYAEAPEVAASYVWHNDRKYVAAKHPIGLLLANAETLRTDWITGQQTTQAGAAHADRAQANYSAAQEAVRLLQDQEVVQ